MVSFNVRKQVDEIRGQGVRRLQELSTLVLLLLIPVFVECWFWSLVITWAIISDNLAWFLYFSVILFIAGLVLFYFIVRYFWQLRNAPQFHVLFIERKEAEQQIDKKRFFRLFLIPVGVSIGLAFIMVPYELWPGHWWSPEHTLWWSLGHTPLTFCPLISVACSSIVLYYAYHIKPERVQRSAPWLLCIPLILSIFYVSTNVELYPIPTRVIGWLSWLSASSWFGVPHSPGDIWFAIVWTTYGYRGLFLTSLIVLLYLSYRINVEQRKVSTFAEGEHLRGFVEEGAGILPKRVRVGDSHNVLLDLTLSKDFVERCSHVEDPHTSGECLEAELEAAELKVAGENRVRICETSPLIIARWNCSFSTSGTHTMNLLMNVVRHDDLRHLIFMHHHTVKVNSLFNISWAPIAALITPILVIMVQVMLKLR